MYINPCAFPSIEVILKVTNMEVHHLRFVFLSNTQEISVFSEFCKETQLTSVKYV